MGRSKTIISIPYPTTKAGMTQWCREYGLNAIYAGKHWTRRKADKEYWHMLVRSELARQGIPRELYQEPVAITYMWDDGLDCSNHAYIAKMIEDALRGWVIKDDCRRWVKAIHHVFYGGSDIVVIVEPIGLGRGDNDVQL